MKFVQSFLLAFISLAVSGRCFILHQNETDKLSKIEGGGRICIKNVPYQIMIKVEGKYICGGALITPNIVLTAAHCVDRFSKSGTKLSVVAGTDTTSLYLGHSFFDKSIEIVAEQMKTYPRYNDKSADSVYYDLALIKLASSFPVTKRIKPISLPKQNVKINDELILTGIGVEKTDSTEMSPCLKFYKPKVVQCIQYVQNERIRNAVICHQDEFGNRARKGDSGSPMVNEKNELVGIHTHSSSTSLYTRRRYMYQVGTNVYHYLDWIRKTMIKYMGDSEESSIFNNENNDIN